MAPGAADELFLPTDTLSAHSELRMNGQACLQYTNGRGGVDTSISGRNISWPLERPNGHERDNSPMTVQDAYIPLHELSRGERRSQSGIALRSFILGGVAGLCLPLSLHTIPLPNWTITSTLPPQTWRVWLLLAVLSTWHFLEFWTHARYNVPRAYISAFLLFNNGWQHTAANTLALLETALTSTFFQSWQARFSHPVLQCAGAALLVLGQACRSLAMAQAGTSFNHKVQTQRARDHRLVTSGVYRYLRHPSYFGFFWWAIGTQLIIGNVVCLVVYVLVLWRFFSRRIAHEETHLVAFFGQDYEKYRATSWVGIPFIT